MADIVFESGENRAINGNEEVKLVEYENTKNIDIMHSTIKNNNLKKMIKISKYRYKDSETGKIYKYKLNKKKEMRV
ncbi:MAG: hypothetical protein IJH12_01520 [Clostridia bacterium]|nr:hypothetical protein [Clostridia bacterium]